MKRLANAYLPGSSMSFASTPLLSQPIRTGLTVDHEEHPPIAWRLRHGMKRVAWGRGTIKHAPAPMLAYLHRHGVEANRRPHFRSRIPRWRMTPSTSTRSGGVLGVPPSPPRFRSIALKKIPDLRGSKASIGVSAAGLIVKAVTTRSSPAHARQAVLSLVVIEINPLPCCRAESFALHP